MFNVSAHSRYRRSLPRSIALLILVLAGMNMGCRSRQSDLCGDSLYTENIRAYAGAEHANAMAREFLWNHWTHRQCGTLYVRSSSLEGHRSDAEYDLTLAKYQGPVLTISFTDWRHGVAHKGSEITHVFGLERVRYVHPFVEKNDQLIAVSEDIPGTQYLLRFKDEQGNFISYF